MDIPKYKLKKEFAVLHFCYKVHSFSIL